MDQAVDDSLVFRQSILKRMFILLSGFFVTGMGLALLLLVPSEDSDWFVVSLGMIATLFGVIGIFFSIIKSRTILVVNKEGITPVFVLGKHAVPIPWDNIEKIDQASQKVKNQEVMYLSIYLKNPEAIDQGLLTSINKLGSRSLFSDGGAADIYISAFTFSQKFDEVLKTLRLMQSKFSVT